MPKRLLNDDASTLCTARLYELLDHGFEQDWRDSQIMRGCRDPASSSRTAWNVVASSIVTIDVPEQAA